MQDLDLNFWKEKYDSNQTGWDLGMVSPPLKAYFDQLPDKTIKILIPGAGNAHEAAYLHQLGFKNVYIVDLVKDVLDNFGVKHPDFDKKHLAWGDFFELKGKFDLIVEQTFFCAINPVLRGDYAKKMAELLTVNGKLVGLLFNRDFDGGPPFGGNVSEYFGYFEDYFNLIKIEECYNSVAPRQGAEVFIQISSIKKTA